MQQKININLIPNSVTPVIHLSQNDYLNGELVFYVYHGSTVLTENIINAVIKGIKPDGNIFIYNSTEIDGNVVTFDVKEQMTAVSGKTVCKLRIQTADGAKHSKTFILDCEADPTTDGNVSESDISALEELIEHIEDDVVDARTAADEAADYAEQAKSTVVDVRRDIITIQQSVSSIQQDVTATQNDVSALQISLNDEISNRQAQEAVISARMDEFAKLPDGSLSTAADAELVDIRIKADGTTAETAGDAVREQIESINDDLAVLDLGLEYSTNRFSGEYTGVVPPSSASRSDTPNANNSTTDFISAEYGDRIYCGYADNIAAALTSYNPVFVTEYDEQKQWLYRSGQFPAVNDENRKLIYTITNANTKYVRVSFANVMVTTSGRLFEIAVNINTAGYILYTPYFAPRVISKRLDRIEDAIDRNVNMKVIDCWGDSRTEMIASQGTSFCDYLQATLGDTYTVCNYGESSQSSGMCAARLGSNEVFVALKNNQIPASGEVQLTNIRCTSGNNRNLFAYSKTSYIPCMLNGVRGRLSRASISTYDDVKFIRDSDGTAVNVHARSKIVVPDMGSKNHLCVLWWGKNDFSNAAQYVVSGIYDNYVKAVKYLGHDKFVILGETCSIKTSYETGGTDRTNLDNLNRMLATEYPDNFIDINAYLSSEQALTDIGLTATAEDLAFIEKGFPCYQLMVYSTNETDTTHPNEYGRQAIAHKIHEWLSDKGWV